MAIFPHVFMFWDVSSGKDISHLMQHSWDQWDLIAI
jgi:hypothetical protein